MKRKRSTKPRCLTPGCKEPPTRRQVCAKCLWQARKFCRSQGITMQQLAEQQVIGELHTASDFRRAHFWKAVERIKKQQRVPGSTAPERIMGGIVEPKRRRK